MNERSGSGYLLVNSIRFTIQFWNLFVRAMDMESCKFIKHDLRFKRFTTYRGYELCIFSILLFWEKTENN